MTLMYELFIGLKLAVVFSLCCVGGGAVFVCAAELGYGQWTISGVFGKAVLAFVSLFVAFLIGSTIK